MSAAPVWVLYGAPLVVLVLLYLLRQRLRESRAVRAHEAAVQQGLTEPPSIHPIVDLDRCVSSGACAQACPEKAIGIVDGRGFLVEPAICIGHGACAASCPVEAITLVFGTERRGIDIPHVTPDFQTNVPGVYIAGELGGMGLIRKSAEQGRQAIESIRRRRRGASDEGAADVTIVGAGPAGIAASLAAMEHGLDFVTVEQEDSLGGTVFHYPRRKVVMTQPVSLPLAGKVRFREVDKEALLAFWEGIVERFRVPIRFGERVESVVPAPGGFEVRTNRGVHRSSNVLLAIGRRGSPRRLGVDGEGLSKVVYRLLDPEQYAGLRVLVVGGGDSAIEAAVTLAAQPGTEVTLAYRGQAFSRAKPANRSALEDALRAGSITVALETDVQCIEAHRVELSGAAGARWIDNDMVVVCAGGVLPTPMLQAIGVMVETKHGTA
ncbi:MAG: NAD(P)-binding domain-containing protein [Chromatiales bacterium]|nr:NAD(P)-binding domain-containing protein [Chromatiales bacterium]